MPDERRFSVEPPPANGPRLTSERAAWEALRRIVAALPSAVDRESFLDEHLDHVVELVGADRGLLLLAHEGGALQVIHGRAEGRALSSLERDEVSRTITRRVLETGETVVLRPLEDASPTESIHAFGIATALAAPIGALRFREGSRDGALHVDPDDEPRVRGVLYVDFRNPRRRVGELEREVVETAAHLLSAVLDPVERLHLAREDLRRLETQGSAPAPRLEDLLAFHGMGPLRREILSCVHGDSSVLILGESGTGKTELARAIAEAGSRRPIVRATLGMADDLNTITSEIFGHEKGSFSGALYKRVGLVEHASGGTLIFDEILNLPPAAQQLLLDFTQFGTYRPLGWERREPKHARVRILAATNGDLERAIREGRFREDLYYRLATTTLDVPPLRARRDDIPALAEALLHRIDGSGRLRFSVPMRRLFLSPALPWAGNVRQLEAVVRRARERALSDDPAATVIGPEHVTPRDLGTSSVEVPEPSGVRDPTAPLTAGFLIEQRELGDTYRRLLREREALDGVEKSVLELALERHGGVAAHAARELGLPRTGFLSRLDTLGIDREARSARRAPTSRGGREEP
jgi:DNA-binding NtrC family response regulator